MAPERVLGWMLGSIGIGIVIAVGVGATILSGIFYSDGCPASGHAPWSCLAWSNVDRFEAQIRAELPLGISSVAVNDYLARENIQLREYRYAPSDEHSLWFGKNLQAELGRSGNPFDGSLTVHVEFDKADNVRSLQLHLNRKATEWKQ